RRRRDRTRVACRPGPIPRAPRPPRAGGPLLPGGRRRPGRSDRDRHVRTLTGAPGPPGRADEGAEAHECAHSGGGGRAGTHVIPTQLLEENVVNIVRNGRGESLTPAIFGPHFHEYGIVGQSPAIAEIIQRIQLVSATRSTVLITGETGTGKELV